MKPRFHSFRSATACLTLTSAILLTCAHGADVYWDINDTTAGAGGTAPAGTWDTGTTNWSSDSTGSSAAAVWANGDSAIFSAGSDATGTFTVTNGGVTVDNITQEEGRVRVSSGTLTLADTSMTINTQTRVSGDYDLRIDSLIADSGAGASSFTKTGAGILLLTNNTNSFSGGVILNQGTLALEGSASNTLLGTGVVTLNGGAFVRSFANSGVSINTTNTLNVQGNVKIGAIQQNNGNWILSGAWQAGSTNGNFNVSNLAADFNGFTPSNVTVFVTGDTSAYTGTFSHNNLASAGNRLRFGVTNSGSVTFNASNAKFFTSGSTTGGNCLDFADGAYGTFQMGELAGTGGRIRAGWSSGGNTTFEVGALNTSTSFAGVLENNANGSFGLAALNKVGTGTLQLSVAGGNLYTAGTTITAGRLLVSNTTGTGTGTGIVTVGVSGILGGSGIIAASGSNGITVNGALAPGGSVSAPTGGSFSNSTGTLTLNMANTTGTVQMNSGATFQMELGSAGASLALAGTSDMIAITGAAAGDLVVNNNLINLMSTGQVGFYKLIDTSLDGTTYSGLTFDSTTGVVSGGLTASNLGAGLTGTLIVGTASNGADSVGDLYLQVVPEPSVALLGGLGALGLLRRRRVA